MDVHFKAFYGREFIAKLAQDPDTTNLKKMLRLHDCISNLLMETKQSCTEYVNQQQKMQGQKLKYEYTYPTYLKYKTYCEELQQRLTIIATDSNLLNQR